LWSGVASAQQFPSRNLRLIVPFPPGGAVDILGRTLAQPLSASLGHNVIVENRAGGNTVIGAELVARAPADGHTLLLMAPSFTINPVVRSNMPYDTFKDFSGVSRLAANPLVVSIHPSVPAKTVKELVAIARTRPGELTFATASILGGQRLAGELLWETARVKVVNVPYNGGAPAATAVMGGHNPILVANVIESAPFITAGRLRGIAVTSLQRAESLPKVPSVAESGYPGFEALNWFGAVARSGTPKSTMNRLSAEIVRALQTPEVKDVLSKQGLIPAALIEGAFDTFMKAEMQRNERIIRALNLKIE
ncbi:MAG TPA: tripartite tricarboxylate transporter substrate binding protein, partial [Burkholderiales bacterium]|nr:tripartite tricarboxylate transporter substrate binding protein [Burkholderiales bacterium]